MNINRYLGIKTERARKRSLPRKQGARREQDIYTLKELKYSIKLVVVHQNITHTLSKHALKERNKLAIRIHAINKKRKNTENGKEIIKRMKTNFF
jgi:hypothetical protein